MKKVFKEYCKVQSAYNEKLMFFTGQFHLFYASGCLGGFTQHPCVIRDVFLSNKTFQNYKNNAEYTAKWLKMLSSISAYGRFSPYIRPFDSNEGYYHIRCSQNTVYSETFISLQEFFFYVSMIRQLSKIDVLDCFLETLGEYGDAGFAAYRACMLPWNRTRDINNKKDLWGYHDIDYDGAVLAKQSEFIRNMSIFKFQTLKAFIDDRAPGNNRSMSSFRKNEPWKLWEKTKSIEVVTVAPGFKSILNFLHKALPSCEKEIPIEDIHVRSDVMVNLFKLYQGISRHEKGEVYVGQNSTDKPSSK